MDTPNDTKMNQPTWVDDLFGGQDKVIYDEKTDSQMRISQDADCRAENEARGEGEYPHYTHNYKGDQSWHYSEDKKTHSESWSFEDEDSDSES
jgi:hypothetical protein